MSPDKETDRAKRIEGYAQWLSDDAKGLADNVNYPAGELIPEGTTTLANARAKLAEALEIIDRAIATDRVAHAATGDCVT